MAGSRKPGPLDFTDGSAVIDQGTLCRQLSSLPSPTDASQAFGHLTSRASSIHSERPKYVHKGGAPKTIVIPVIQIGSRGPDVQKLQHLLNSRLSDGTQLKADGWCGPLTHAVVLQFQKVAGLRADGIVGRKTWFKLVATPVPKTPTVVASTRFSTRAAAQPAPARAPAEITVLDWPLTKRFEYVVPEAGRRLPAETREQFSAMIHGSGLAFIAGTLVVWAGGHFFGVSEITDAFLLGFGLPFLGWAAVDAARDLKNSLELTVTASTEAELNQAASDFAQFLTIVGVVAFFALLAKVGKGLGKAEPEEDAAPAAADQVETGSPRRAMREKPHADIRLPKDIVLKTVPSADIDLARSSGSSAAQFAARKAVAEAFYREHFIWPKERTPQQIEDGIQQHIKGIDFKKPVIARLSPPPYSTDSLVQWRVPGEKQGPYYGRDGATPSQLGVGNWGVTSSFQVERKVPVNYSGNEVAPTGTRILESTARGITDDFSIRVGEMGTLQGAVTQSTKGGGTQYLIPSAALP